MPAQAGFIISTPSRHPQIKVATTRRMAGIAANYVVPPSWQLNLTMCRRGAGHTPRLLGAACT